MYVCMIYACIMYVCIYRRAESTGSTIYVCMHVLCMYVRNSARYSARRSLFAALIGALVGIDSSVALYLWPLESANQRAAFRPEVTS